MTVTGNVYAVIYEEKECSGFCVISMPPSLLKGAYSDTEDTPGNGVTNQAFDFRVWSVALVSWNKSQRSKKGHPFPLWCQLLLSDRQQPTWCFLSLGPILPPAGLSRGSLPCRDDKNEGDATEGVEHVS